MYIWTIKVEKEWRRRHPDNNVCPRKAGKVATYCGQVLNSGQIADAYLERGIVSVQFESSKEVETATTKNQGVKMKSSWKEKRWKQLQFWFSQESTPSLTFVAYNMGIRDSCTLTKFVRKYGKELAAKYGKLKKAKKIQWDRMGEHWEAVVE